MIAAEMFGVDPGVKLKRIDVRIQGVGEVFAQPRFFFLVEGVTLRKVTDGGGEDEKFHLLRRRSSFLAVSQPMGFSSPERYLASRSLSTSSCHFGDGTASVWQRSSQRVSMA